MLFEIENEDTTRRADEKDPQWHEQPVDGGLLRFNRSTGLNVLQRGPSTANLRRIAPRVLQVGLLTPCNLSCNFCYRDQSAPSKLTTEFLVPLLKEASDWGVLEVAFGGGEPLLFRGFSDMVDEITATTQLGINLTTNGTLLTETMWERWQGRVGELRLSAYANNDYRAQLARFRGQNVGVNWLVTPQNVGMVEPMVHDFLANGAKNVLLLGYKGGDPSLHLRSNDLEQLQKAVSRLSGLPLRLDICWYPQLGGVSHLFERPDCGAGDEFLVITPDRAVQPCSFHHELHPFSDFGELKAIYTDLQERRPAARIGGCSRSAFTQRPLSVPAEPEVWTWMARASNNSGDWTMAARFCDEETARKVAQSLRELARAQEVFVSSPEGQNWLEEHDYFGATPTLQKFGEAHGFEWIGEDAGLNWEEEGYGAPVLTAGAVGNAVVVYHPYCMGLPEEPFRQFFGRAGATGFEHWQYDRPRLRISAQGDNPEVEKQLSDYLDLAGEAEYPSDIAEPPPWGEKVNDPRVTDDEDLSALIGDGEGNYLKEGQSLTLEICMENTFAGAIALESWLKRAGYKQVTVEIESQLTKLPSDVTRVEPRVGLFGDVRPLAERISELSDEKLVSLAYSLNSLPDVLIKRLEGMPSPRLVELALPMQREALQDGTDVTLVARKVIELVGTSAASLAEELWALVRISPLEAERRIIPALAVALPHERVFELTVDWASETDVSQGESMERLLSLESFGDHRVLELTKRWWSETEPKPSVMSGRWGPLMANSRITWKDVEEWLALGRPHSLLMLDGLCEIATRGEPYALGAPDVESIRVALKEYTDRDTSPRNDSAWRTLLPHLKLFISATAASET